jgi:hypothetical protein
MEVGDSCGESYSTWSSPDSGIAEHRGSDSFTTGGNGNRVLKGMSPEGNFVGVLAKHGGRQKHLQSLTAKEQ